MDSKKAKYCVNLMKEVFLCRLRFRVMMKIQLSVCVHT